MNQFNVILAVKNASKKFLSPERDREIYEKHFSTPLESAAQKLGVSLQQFGGSIKKITSTVRNLEVLTQLIKCKEYKKVASIISSYSAIIGPVVGMTADAIIKGLQTNNVIGPLVAAKLQMVVSLFSLGIVCGFAVYIFFTAKELYGLKCAYDKAKEEIEDPEIKSQLNEISTGIETLKSIENELKDIFNQYEALSIKENGQKDYDGLLAKVQEKVAEANAIYGNTSDMIKTLNAKLKALNETMACSQESSETTAKVSYGLTLASGAATVGAMFVPGLNLLVAGSLVAGFATAATATAVGVYYTVSYRELIKQVADMQANLDGQTEEMNAIKGRIDEMLKKAESLGGPKPGEEGHVDMDQLLNDF